MANRCSIQLNGYCAAGDRPVICPKPRRLYSPADASDPKSANHLLDALFPKLSDPAPLFLCGSPPTRSNNPMVHDARFGEAIPLAPTPIASAGIGSGSVKNVCTRIRYGIMPAAVRIEGFDCLDRERTRSRGIQAVA
ncbi:hypothetical protein M5K25_009325 [Dendrobium thyrsiflorum]|uniref:Uncharacterized protein n=1 Tax=Dendrobium thyrsiflorum TaxID=117978 RepID=A0ABD0V5I8_DENTH